MFTRVFDTVVFNVLLMLGILGIIYFWTTHKFKNRNRLMDEFLEDEHEANTARRRAVEPEHFFTADTDKLPLSKNAEGDLLAKQEQVLKQANLKMVRFPKKMTNLELKQSYGRTNLEIITGYEENYNLYVRSLVNWAEALLENGSTAEAIAVLETTVDLGSDFRKTYMHLADYYGKKSQPDDLNRLIGRAAEIFEDEGIKQQLLQYIMDKKEGV